MPYAHCIAWHAGVHSAVDLGLRVMTAPAKLTTATLTAATRPAISLLAGVLSVFWRAQFIDTVVAVIGPVCVCAVHGSFQAPTESDVHL